jgi:hypothetical protein
MADLKAIEQLMARYCYAHDERDLDMLRTCFAQDAVMHDRHGPDEITEGYAMLYQQMTARRRHILTNFLFLEEGDNESLVAAYETFYLIKGDKLELHLTGVYQIRVVIEAGAWKIKNMAATFDVPFDPGDLPRVEARTLTSTTPHK